MAAGAREGGASGASTRRAPVVLLHGFAQHADSWDEVAEGLRQRGFKAIAPELAELPGAASGDDLSGVCAAVDSLCRNVARQEGRPPVLAGYSMGGRIALETVLRSIDGASSPDEPCPSRSVAGAFGLPCCALVLESAGVGPETEGDRLRFAERNAGWARRIREQGVEAFMDWWEELPLFASQRDLPADDRERLRAGRIDNDPGILSMQLAAWGAQHQTLRPKAWGLLRGLMEEGFPLAYFAGALDGKYSLVAEAVAELPGATAVIFPNVGHNVHLEDPSAFVERLCGILPA